MGPAGAGVPIDTVIRCLVEKSSPSVARIAWLVTPSIQQRVNVFPPAQSFTANPYFAKLTEGSEKSSFYWGWRRAGPGCLPQGVICGDCPHSYCSEVPDAAFRYRKNLSASRRCYFPA